MANYKGNNNLAKGKRRPNVSRKGKKEAGKDMEFDAKTATNDPKWYGMDPALLRDSASIPFSWSVGTPIDLHNPALDSIPGGQAYAIPGICKITLVPSLGRTKSASDPVNVAAFQIYSFVRHLNSGHSNYDAPDLMIYLTAMSQVYSYINYLQRVYGTVSLYAQKNRYLPNHLLTAMGVDPESVRSSLASFRYSINVLINKAASLCVPAVMPLFARYASMYQNIYIEGGTMKDQLYFYNPDGFWFYNLNADQSGMLEYKMLPVSGAGMTVDDMIDYGNNMLARLVQSEDMNIMSGDIRKAYGDGALIKLTPLPEFYPIVPIPDAAVLLQMKNATIVRGIKVEELNVIQDPSHAHLVFNPKANSSVRSQNYQTKADAYLLQGYLEDRVLTLDSPEPTPEEIMETTRLMVVGSNYVRSEDGLNASLELDTGSEIAIACHYYYVDIDSDVPILASINIPYLAAMDMGSEEVGSFHKYTSLMSNFRYHPAVHLVLYKKGSSADSFKIGDAMVNFDVNNYAIVPTSTIARIHEAALLSEMNVPSVLKI